MKTCTKCKLELDETEFHKNSRSKDGLRSYCKECNKGYYQKYKSDDPERVKNKWRVASKKYHTYDGRRNKTLRGYGLTEETYNKMYDAQEGKCAICESELTLCVDHCHKSNQVRGLLCNNCNLGLGMFQDNPDRIREAIAYLKKYEDKK